MSILVRLVFLRIVQEESSLPLRPLSHGTCLISLQYKNLEPDKSGIFLNEWINEGEDILMDLVMALIHGGLTIFYDHNDETIRAGGDIIKARDRII